MNKILWTKDCEDTKITDFVVQDESLTISYNDNSITFSTYHEQDCCESVYGDFSIAKYHKEHLVGKDLKNIEVKAVEHMGFLLCFTFKWETYEKIFIPCYNSQNGYYSSNLSLNITEGTVETQIDISDLAEDNID